MYHVLLDSCKTFEHKVVEPEVVRAIQSRPSTNTTTTTTTSSTSTSSSSTASTIKAASKAGSDLVWSETATLADLPESGVTDLDTYFAANGVQDEPWSGPNKKTASQQANGKKQQQQQVVRLGSSLDKVLEADFRLRFHH
jgi:hypothetical protein